METALLWLGVVSILEVSLWLTPVWRVRRLILWPLGVGLVVLTGLLLVQTLAVWTVLIALGSLYRLINYRRILAGRMYSDYLYRATRRTAYWLIGLQTMLVVVLWLVRSFDLSVSVLWYLFAVVQLGALGIILYNLAQKRRAMQPVTISEPLTDSELPTVSVLIPARNETKELEECLTSLLASDYSKLEILVLDDCSQNKRTPEIIRSFAQSGVRFVAGSAPPDKWLAKNYAYQQLAEHANGEILLFCGVDTRFTPKTLRSMITLAQKQSLSMVSFMPRNVLDTPAGLLGRLIQPSRYGWEVSVPRTRRHPPVLSTCWLIHAELLAAAGGFAAVTRKPVPESYFARYAATEGKYAFLQAAGSVELVSHKTVAEQQATAIRTRYPQLHRRPELVVVLSLALFAVFVWPLGLIAAAVLATAWPLAIITLASLALGNLIFAELTQLTFNTKSALSYVLMPLAGIYDIVLLNYSMWQYEFGEVLWKGRNICLPVMHAPLVEMRDKHGKG